MTKRREEEALVAWLDGVAAALATMSPRQVASAKRKGDLAALVGQAKARKVSLVHLTDDRSRELLAASTNPVSTLC